MSILRDYAGKSIRLTVERMNHIKDHPEMKGMLPKIAQALSDPQKVIQSLSDA